MSDSETSINNNVEYQNALGENLLEDRKKKSLTTDTDLYFDKLANPSKIMKKSDSETSELQDGLKNEMLTSDSEKSGRNSDMFSERRTERNTERHTERRTERQTERQTEKQDSPKNIKTADVKVLTAQEIRMKKIELLRKLCEIKSKGFKLSKEYDYNSSLEEMEYEYELLKSFVDKRNGVKLFKNGLLQAVSVIEFLNDKYDPFDFHLSGWGEHMAVDVDSWEDVMEELYEKYKGSGKKMAPEIKLLYLIIASASAFHFSKSQASKLPGLDSVLASNPGLLSKMMNPTKKESQFVTPQELNIEKQKNEMNQQKTQNNQRNTQQNTNTNSYNNLNIKSSDEVKNILDRIHNTPPSNNKPTNNDTQDDTSSNNDRLISETTMSESSAKKKRQPKKSNISIF
jgi:hypothetical protein